MVALRSILFSLLVTALLGVSSVAEQVNDDAAANDDAQEAYYYNNLYANGDFSAGDDQITYWTNYAILPKRCIV